MRRFLFTTDGLHAKIKVEFPGKGTHFYAEGPDAQMRRSLLLTLAASGQTWAGAVKEVKSEPPPRQLGSHRFQPPRLPVPRFKE